MDGNTIAHEIDRTKIDVYIEYFDMDWVKDYD